MTSPPVQRRGTKPAEVRRAEILEAAARLFHQTGYDATTVQHIAAAAGVAAGTVYLYFPSKEHVLLGLHEDFHAGIDADMEATFTQLWARLEGTDISDREALELMVGAMVDAVVAFLRKDPVKSAVMARFLPRLKAEHTADHDHSAAYIAAAIQFGVELGRVEIADPEMASLLIASALSLPLLRMVVEGNAADVDRLATQAKEFFVKALEPRG